MEILASNLEDNDFKYLMSKFPIDKVEILKRKDAYPYEWVKSHEKFDYNSYHLKYVFIHH